MKALRRVANWIDFFVSLIASVYLFTVVLGMAGSVEGFWRKVVTFKLAGGSAVYAALSLSLLLLLCAALRAVQSVQGHTASRYLRFDTPNGKVSVRVGSVEEVIDRTVRAMDEVADAASSLELPRGADVPKGVIVRCRLYNRPNLLAIQDQVRAVVRQAYGELFPTEEPLQVQVRVERILFQSSAAKGAPKPPADLSQDDDESSEPIRPQYPVDEA